jgi:hypothetical protein
MKKSILNKTAKFFKTAGLLVLVASAFVACKDDDTSDPSPNNDSNSSNKVAFEATDAPLDNAEVFGAFVTVSEIWVDGNKIDGYNKTTFELSALTNGKTEMMDEFDIDATSMSQVIFKLDYENDADGNQPGTYVLKADGTKDMMKSSTDEIVISKAVDFNSNSTTNIVFDFDLRKMIREESDGDYELVADAKLNSAVRAVEKENSGMVKGNIDDQNNNLDSKNIIYLYKKGMYNAAEMEGNGRTELAFSNAENSAEIDGSGNFQLSYIENSGEYEMYLFTYDDADSDGKFEVSGMTQLLFDGETTLNGTDISSGADLNLSLSLITILPL